MAFVKLVVYVSAVSRLSFLLCWVHSKKKISTTTQRADDIADDDANTVVKVESMTDDKDVESEETFMFNNAMTGDGDEWSGVELS